MMVATDYLDTIRPADPPQAGHRDRRALTTEVS